MCVLQLNSKSKIRRQETHSTQGSTSGNNFGRKHTHRTGFSTSHTFVTSGYPGMFRNLPKHKFGDAAFPMGGKEQRPAGTSACRSKYFVHGKRKPHCANLRIRTSHVNRHMRLSDFQCPWKPELIAVCDLDNARPHRQSCSSDKRCSNGQSHSHGQKQSCSLLAARQT